MKAIVYHKYGSPDVLQLEEVYKPTPRDNEVLIKIHATSLNSWDWDLLRGKPFIVRIAGGGLLKPKKKIIGCDVAGQIEAIGKNVKMFLPGDEVFGDLSGCGWGGLAEYVCASENALSLKSTSMTFEQAAAIPQAGVMALQGIRDYGKVQPGQKVLINGAGGGVGKFAIQLAKSYGAEVTAVDSKIKLEMLRSIGADHTIDYMQEDFYKNGKLYDLIIDVVANRSIFVYKRSLKPNGIFLMVGGTTSSILQTAFMAPFISMAGNKKLGLLIHQPNKDLDFLKELFEADKFVPVLDQCYPLYKAPEALLYLGHGKALGKIVITMEQNGNPTR